MTGLVRHAPDASAPHQDFKDLKRREKLKLAKRRQLILLDRHPIGTDENLHALRLLSVLIKLIAEQAGDDDERADEKIDDVAAIHGFDLDIERRADDFRSTGIALRLSSPNGRFESGRMGCFEPFAP
jgi:hypothetical protein